MRRFLLCFALLAACGDDDTATTPVEPPADAALPTASDAAVTTDAAVPVQSKGIPLVDWVDDLVDHHTDDTSAPDTVDDKKIDDDEDPSHFQSRF